MTGIGKITRDASDARRNHAVRKGGTNLFSCFVAEKPWPLTLNSAVVVSTVPIIDLRFHHVSSL